MKMNKKVIALTVSLIIMSSFFASIVIVNSAAGDNPIDQLWAAIKALQSQISGFTGRGRSVVFQGQYAVLNIENITTSTLAGWAGTKRILMAPAMGANRWEYWIKPGNNLGGSIVADGKNEYIVYMLEWTAELTHDDLTPTHNLDKGDAVFIPQDMSWSIKATNADTTLYVIKKAYDSTMSTVPQTFGIYHLHDDSLVPWTAYTPARPQRQKNILVGYDLRIILLEAAPTGGTAIIETHVEEHGVILIQGEGVYLLGNTPYPMKSNPTDPVKDDFCWVGPYTVHEFTNTGNTNAKYILTKG